MTIWRVSVFLMVEVLRAADPTYTQEIAPILNQHCVVCHRANDIAPMPLESYKETRPRAASIREAVASHKLPPWHGDPQFHQFANDARLTDSEIATLIAWVSTGAKEGTSSPPAAPTCPAGWHIHPDVVLSLAEEQIVEAGAQDAY